MTSTTRVRIQSSEDGEISQSVKYLRKASEKAINKIYKQVEAKRLEKANDFVTDILISRFAGMLGGFDAIESSAELDKELQRDKLLKRDVQRIVGSVLPYIPAVGILSGGVNSRETRVRSHVQQGR